MDECRELLGLGFGDWAAHSDHAYELASGGPWSEVGDLSAAADHELKLAMDPKLARHTLHPPSTMPGLVATPSAFTPASVIASMPPITANNTHSIALGTSPRAYNASSSSCASGSVLTHVFSLSSTATAGQQLWPANDLVSTSEEGDWDLSAALSLAEDVELGQQLCEAGLLGTNLTPIGPHRTTVLDDGDSVDDASLCGKFSIGSDTPFREKLRGRKLPPPSVRYAMTMISDSDNDDDFSLDEPSVKRSKVSRGGTPRKGSLPSGRSADEEHSPSSSTEDKKRRKQHNPWTLEETEVLIAGVEQCGGGRWAEIKKLGYAVIDRRSPVDLKDKWRNLIRVACQPGSSHARSRCDKRREIPEELLARVRAVVESSRATPGRGGHH